MADALDKLKSSWNKSLNTISIKTSTSMEKNRLKSQIDAQNAEIQKLYREAGEIAYLVWSESEAAPDSTAVEQVMGRIWEAFNNIAKLREEIEIIEEKERLALQAAEAEAAPPAPPTPVCYCPRCGAGYATPVKFCRACGTKMPELN